MKRYYSTFIIVLIACYVSAQQSAVTPVAKPDMAPVAAPHDHDHDHGHDHDHSHEAEDATPVVVNPNAANISFKEVTYNFGEIPEGPQATHEFKFVNTGKEPLILSNVRASCGCTTPSWPKEPILPGKEGAILVTYNTQGRPGNFSKTITITSNANESNKVIDIKGDVIKPDPEKSVPLEGPSMLSPH
ncbi:MAG: DUF1573 domain-containing protein [Bacteroidota bacterium]